MKYTFTPNIKTVAQFEPIWTTDIIKNEPMMFSVDPAYAHTHGGSLTREITRILLKSKEYKEIAMFASDDDFFTVIDTRVTMTMPGMYPSIPGWHCDDVPRSKTTGQPVLHSVNPFVQHFMVILSDQESVVSATEFVSKEIELDIDLANVWNSVDRQINELKPDTGFIKPGDIVRFNQEAIHRASPTITAGWRFFYRLSITHREPANEVRNQVQVYASENGW